MKRLLRLGARLMRRAVPVEVARGVFVAGDRLGWHYTAPDERTSCPVCGSREIEHLHPLPLVGRQGKRTGFATGCHACGVVFANPMPSSAALAQMYSPDGEWGRSRQQHDREASPHSRYVVRLLDGLRPAFRLDRPAAGSAVLDFGCGSGELLDLLQDFGWQTYGIEPAEKHAFSRHLELEAIPREPMFRLAIAHHVLEHVSDPLPLLRALHGSLEPGGLLLVSVPRLDTLPRHRDFHYCINARAHILAYTRDCMATLLGVAGFAATDLNPAPGEEQDDDWRALKRMRMIGRKGGAAVHTPRPLRAAIEAFESWAEMDDPAARRRPRRMPARAAAALQNFERNRSA